MIVATNKRILRSRDSGQSWDVVHVLEQVPNPVTGGGALQTRLTLLYHHPASMGTIFAVVRGHDGSTYSTTTNHYALISRDGGTSWEQLVVDGWEVALDQNSGERSRSEWRFAHDPAAPDIFWMHIRDRSRISERYGRKFYRSADGGESWQDIPALLKQGRDTTNFNTDAGSYPGEDYFYVHPLGGDTLVFGLSVGHYRESGELFFDGTPTGTNPLLLPAPDTFLRFRWVRLRQINTPAGLQFAIMWEEEEYEATYLFSGEFPNAHIYDVCKSIGPPYDPFDLTAPPWTPWVYLVGSTRIPTNQAGRVDGWDPPRASSAEPAHSPDPPGGSSSTAIYTRNQLCHPDRYNLLRGGIVSWGSFRETGIRRILRGDPRLGSEEVAPPVGRVLKISPSKQQPDQVWAATRDGDPALTGIWRSNDYADTWEMVHADPLIETVHVHEADDQVIYTNRSVSRDGGGSWEDRTVQEGATIRSRDRMRSHSQDTSILYVCHSNGGLRRWSDYLQADTLMAPSETYGFCRDLFVFPDTPERMWLGSDKGLFETLDGGETWERRNRGLPNAPITRIVIAPDRSEIMVGVLAYGLFVVDANEVGIVPVHRVSTEDPGELPVSGALLTNYPNPFVDETQLRFTTEKPGHVRLEVFDVLGRQVATATDQLYGGGSHQVRLRGAGLTSGVYLVRLQVDGRQVGVQKMVRR